MTFQARSTPGLPALGGVLGFGAFLALLNSTVVVVGIDRLSGALAAPLGQIQWVTTAYLLALAVAIPVAGWGADRFGGRTLWLAALGVYLAGSALATVADSLTVLVGARVVQGFGAGMLEPIMLAMLTTAAGPHRATRVLSLIQIPITLAPALGPLAGGLIIDHLSWRWLFAMNLPLGLLAMVLSLRVLPRDRPKTGTTRLDVLGLLLLPPGLAVLLYGLTRAGDGFGADSVAVFAPVLGGTALLLGYAAHALRRGSGALIDLRLFADARFTASGLIACLFGASVYGMMFLLPLYAQQANGARAWVAGLQLAPQGIGTILALPFVAALSARFGARATVAGGMSLAALGTLPFTQDGLHAGTGLLAVSLLVRGIGLGAVLGPALAAAFGAIAPDATARASSALVALIQIGGAAGTALLAVVLQRQPGGAGVAAFASTFWWALAICVLGSLLALRLPGKINEREVTHVGK
ncbi:DHA2 family efflux MFS transporter permease subunit [Nonomuraea guangzhouensis]|uniref:DHA2 family efflux MFS transporter permease subunit n=1 Tax=Nonomuraea guangzhouensis TaxID=1291555 RepID=A0ABW4G1N5_9ACTN|nr:DHA2 family efflux MFS transporter permease subunit [Nonomuraea guangzhouensis]